MIIRIRYEKLEPANLIGHLDTMEIIKRGLRIAAFPLKFTQGYNPRIKLSSTPPLKLGYESFCEYIDIELISPPAKYQIDKFKRSLIEGINIKKIEVSDDSLLPINAEIKGFRYKIEFKGLSSLNLKVDNIVKMENNFIIVDIFKKDGNIPNPKKIIGDGDYKVTKINCL